jgi:hypothetical protein
VEVAVDLIRHELPRLWSQARPPSDLTERDWLLVEAACDRAYRTISTRYQEIGQPDIAIALREADASADFDAAAWQTAFEAVIAQNDLAALAALLLPTNTAQGLMALDPTDMSLDDMADELYRWAKESKEALAGDLPSEDTLRTIVALWTEPEVAVKQDWRRALDTMISERSVSRAARYLALRHRRARWGGAM